MVVHPNSPQVGAPSAGAPSARFPPRPMAVLYSPTTDLPRKVVLSSQPYACQKPPTATPSSAAASSAAPSSAAPSSAMAPASTRFLNGSVAAMLAPRMKYLG